MLSSKTATKPGVRRRMIRGSSNLNSAYRRRRNDARGKGDCGTLRRRDLTAIAFSPTLVLDTSHCRSEETRHAASHWSVRDYSNYSARVQPALWLRREVPAVPRQAGP